MKPFTDPVWREALRGLERGDFSRLEPLFDRHPSLDGDKCRIVDWYENIEALLAAGANIDEAGYPSGDKRVDEVLGRHQAKE